MAGSTTLRASAPLPPAAASLVQTARATLRDAAWETDAGQRYATAHLAALRGAAAVLAARARVESRPPRRRPASAWELLGSVAPELAEWAAFFAAGAPKRAAAEAGLAEAATAPEADDLLRDVASFLDVVEHAVGLAA
jgi:hypothetical protein